MVLYVATNGNDAWSGELVRPSFNGRDGPLATLAGALAKAHAARTNAPASVDSVTILVRGGTYRLPEPIVITSDDSGPDAARPLLIAAYPNEKPVLSGGRRLTEWREATGRPGLWETTVPEVKEGRWEFRQLFVNGQRRQRARTPNTGYFRIQGENPRGQPAQLRFQPGDLRPEWAQPGNVELVALLAWADFRMFIRAVDTNTGVATLSTEPRPSNRENNARYYIENAPDALDQRGEWYLDRQTGVVRYWALPGENLAAATNLVTAPVADTLLVLRGDADAGRPVRHVVLRGLAFTETDWVMPAEGYADTQAAISIRGDVIAEAAVDCVIEDCTFTRLGGYALELGRGCQRFRVVGNEMFDLGAGGIRVGETHARSQAADLCEGHVITDNHLHHLGLVYPPAVGVLILQSGHNRVAHNHIHDLFYTAISAGWNWGYQETPCHHNVIEFNHLHDIGKGMLSDMGAVYTLGIQTGTVIRNNLIHDVNAFTYGGWGLYTDEGSSEILLENNVVYRCKSAGFHQHYGRDNVIRNNVFALNREHQLMRTREEDHVSFTFERNIVYFESGELLGSNWKNDRFRMNGNVYFDARPEAHPETMRFAGATFDEWRRRGHDTDSLIADPLFANPRGFNFRLNAQSPALKLGFAPIDLSQVGIRRKGQRH
jgi:parallel beta-helix repeat protein